MTPAGADLAIGIDLGTTYSCVGLWHNNGVNIIANAQGNFTTPSYVAFTDTEELTGEEAKDEIGTNTANTIFDAKRLIGRIFSDPSVQNHMKLWPFKVIVAPGDKPMIVVHHKREQKLLASEDIYAMMLIKMREIAEVSCGCLLTKAVLTVPVYFTEFQRQATKEAALIARLSVLRVIDEPTAAAIVYGLVHKPDTTPRNLLIFYLGGGSSFVSLFTIGMGIFEVKATLTDHDFGGENFNRLILNHCVEEFLKSTEKDVRGNPKGLWRLRTACEWAKRTLSSSQQARIEVESMHEDVDFSIAISRSFFEDLCEDLFIKCIQSVKKCLGDAKVDKNWVDEVFIAGGSSRMPKVRQLLQDFFTGKELYMDINPDETLAYGAAVLAEIDIFLAKQKNRAFAAELQILTEGLTEAAADYTIMKAKTACAAAVRSTIDDLAPVKQFLQEEMNSFDGLIMEQELLELTVPAQHERAFRSSLEWMGTVVGTKGDTESLLKSDIERLQAVCTELENM